LTASDTAYAIHDDVVFTIRNNQEPWVRAGADLTTWIGSRSPDAVDINGGRFIPPFLWAANHDNQSVTRFNTETTTQDGLYWVGANPSRTAVDLDGNMWVGGRDDGRLTKVLWDTNACPDRNNNGQVDTSRPNAMGVPVQLNSAADPLADECVVFSQVINTSRRSIRGIAAGPDGRVWIGYTDGGVQSIDPNTFEVGAFYDQTCVPRFAPDANNVQQPVAGQCGNAGGVYGLVIDSNGYLYISSFNRNTLARFDTVTERWDALYTGIGCGMYGITIDSRNRVWFGSWPQCGGVGMFDPVDLKHYGFTLPDSTVVSQGGSAPVTLIQNGAAGGGGRFQTTGVAAQPGTDNIWMSFFNIGWIGRLEVDENDYSQSTIHFVNVIKDANGNGLAGVGNDLRGIGFDGRGFGWTLGLGSDRLWKMDPGTNLRADDLPVGKSIGVGSHYTYSDFTGSTALWFTVPRQIRDATLLDGSVTDDGLPSDYLISFWRLLDGPGAVEFQESDESQTEIYFSEPGVYTFELTGNDGELTGTDIITVTVLENQPPTITLAATLDAAVGEPLALGGTVTDDGLPQGDEVRTSWHVVSGPGAVVFADNSPDAEATFFVPGTYVIELVADDTLNGALADVTVTVSEGNRPPTVVAGANQTLLLPQTTATLSATVTDDGLPANGQLTLSWTVVQAPGHVLFGAPTAATTSVTVDAAGFYRFRLTASDGQRSAAANIDLTVDAPGNATPAVNVGADLTLTLGEVARLYGTVVDEPQTNLLTTLWTAESGPGPVTFEDDGARVTTASFAELGTWVLRLTADDGELTAFDELIVEVVAPLNQPPSVNAGLDLSLTLPASATLSATATDDGLPGGPITWMWRQTAGPDVAVFDDATLASPQVTFPALGRYILVAAANDGQISGEDTVVVTVGDGVNTAPLVTAGPDATVAAGLDLLMGGTVVDTDPVTVVWTLASGPGLVTILASDLTAPAVSQTVRFAVPGTYVFHLSADDGTLAAADELVVTVTPGTNLSPTVSAGADLSIYIEDNLAELQGTASDDGLPPAGGLSTWWSKVAGPGSVAFSDASSLTPTASFTAVGDYTLRLTASDTLLSASDEVTVQVAAIVNLPPVVDAGADQSTSAARPITLVGAYADDAFPRDRAETFAWSVTDGPGEVRFGSPTATMTTATFSEVGLYTLRLTVSDGQATGFDELLVDVVENLAPEVDPGPSRVTQLGDAFELVGFVTDDGLPGSGLTASWSQRNGPAIAVLTPVAAALPEVRASVHFPTTGAYRLALTANDGQRSTTAEINVSVVAYNQAPTVDLGPDLQGTTEAPVILTYTVSDDGLPTGRLLTNWTADGPVQIDGGNGQAILTFPGPGSWNLTLTVSDGVLTGQDTVRVTILPSPNEPPDVELLTPFDDTVLTAPFEVVGRAQSPILESWALQLRDKSPNAPWTTLATGDANIDAALHTLDPTLLRNGVYELRLTATDTVGRTSIAGPVPLSVEGAMKVGHFTVSFLDMEVPVAGVPMRIVRTYDSREKRNGDFGVGWSVGLSNVKVQKNRGFGANWYEYPTGAAPFLWYNLDPISDRIVTITLPHDEVLKFRASSRPSRQLGFPIAAVTVTYEPVGDTAGSLVALDWDQPSVVGSVPGVVDLLDLGTGELYEPTRFRYTSPDGDIWELEEGVGLHSLTDRWGNSLSVDANGAVHSSGVTLTFDRDALGRITAITDPMGQSLTYTYTDDNGLDQGHLVSVTDREGQITTFTYHDAPIQHHLRDIIDPRGVRVVRNEFDAEGRLVRQIDPDGLAAEWTRDLEARVEIVTNRLGYATTATYNARGDVTSITDALGNTTTSTFDQDGNELTRTGPLGHAVTKTFNLFGDVTTEVDPLGHVTRTNYDSQLRPSATIDPDGGVTAIAFTGSTVEFDTRGASMVVNVNRDGEATSLVDAAGNRTENDVDGRGRVTERRVYDSTNLLLRHTSFTHDDNGQVLTQTERRQTVDGERLMVTAFEYDANGRVTRTTWPDGSTVEQTWTSFGRVATRTDELRRVTTWDYDDTGHLTTITFPGGATQRFEYDAEGQKTAELDELGRRTAFEYDPAGRLVQTTFPDLTTRTVVYDELGREVAVADELGHTLFTEYDPNCGCTERRTVLSDELGNETRFTYDVMGNVTSVTDALGQRVRYDYDSRNRRIAERFDDGTVRRWTYDDLGRVITHTDGLGRTVVNAWDGQGNLVAVTDAADQLTTYTYDAVGDLVAQTDANGHTTQFEVDDRGRRTARVLPGGQRETWTWDVAGQLTGHTDLDGHHTTWSYDTRGRLLTTTPDPVTAEPTVTFGYDRAGQRTSMTDGTGTTTFQYDARGRRTEKASPWGTLRYQWDDASHLTRLTAVDGVDVEYTYDALGRLSTATEAIAGTTSWTWDPVGNLVGAALPNGVSSAWTYNSRNQLTHLASDHGANRLTEYNWTLDAEGRRTRQTERSGRDLTWTRDPLDRLLTETITAPNGAPTPVGASTYTWDPVGNRLTRASTLTGLDAQTFTYDLNDRLDGLTYDNNGNILQANGHTDTYSFDNRLVDRDGDVQLTWDGDGNLVARTVGGLTTWFLVDELNPTGYTQVVEERVFVLGQPMPVRSFIWGVDLVAIRWDDNGPITRFPLVDGLGSVRQLTDENGAITDQVDYDAFGNILWQTGDAPNPYLFAGERFDADLGMTFLRARFLDPDLGRFWTADTFAGHLEDPVSLHKYLYANGNPVDYLDPSGQFTLAEVNFAVTIGFSVVAGALDGFNHFQKTGNLGTSIAIGIISAVKSFVFSKLIPFGKWAGKIPGVSAAGAVGEKIVGDVMQGIADLVANSIINQKLPGTGDIIMGIIVEPFLGAGLGKYADSILNKYRGLGDSRLSVEDSIKKLVEASETGRSIRASWVWLASVSIDLSKKIVGLVTGAVLEKFGLD